MQDSPLPGQADLAGMKSPPQGAGLGQLGEENLAAAQPQLLLGGRFTPLRIRLGGLLGGLAVGVGNG
ncbi:hypothetical protein [Sporichthya polymorpha]|uniref:hypothetical protein n=1 Tax=Sporichthya polymorpha TaxID=35751 RepID=UPI0012EB410A|nr:hypothetical protein [Sporichthya polymorpha]